MTTRTQLALLLALTSCLVAASASCDDGSGSEDTTPVDTSADVDAAPCPAAAPSAGAGCTRAGLVCEYGDDPRRECHTLATCDGASFSLTEPECEPLPAVTCPPTRDAAAGEGCSPQGAWCAYDGLVCECTNCVEYPVAVCEGEIQWTCEAPNADASCPPARPHLGEPCDDEGATCTWGCGFGNATRCDEGVWVRDDGGPCPISTRRAKTDIEYLDATEVDALAHQIEALPLASWRYRDPALGDGVHLGFVLEDAAEGSPAVDAERAMVDLYGYAAMLHATVQSQARALEAQAAATDALRLEVEQLRRDLDEVRRSCQERASVSQP